MNTWTAHTAPGRPPVLLREGFSWGAFVFGPLWLAARRAWMFAAAALAIDLALAGLAPGWTLLVAALAYGVFGEDLVRRTLEHRGYALVHVVAASTGDNALARLLARRPDLVGDAVGLEGVR